MAEVADVVGGGTPRTADDANFGDEVPWLTPKDLATHRSRYVVSGKRGLSHQGLSTSSARVLPTGTILLSTRAPIGYVAVAGRPVATNQGFRSLILREGQVSEYWYYLLKNSRPSLEAHANGTTFKELAGSTLARLQFRVPEQAEQRAIAEVLGSLDDKIESNERVRQLADDTLLARVTHAIESGPTVDRPLSAIASFVNGRAFTKGATGTGRMVIRIAELGSDPGGSTVYNDIEVPEQHLARPGDLLFAWSGSLTVQRWFREEAIVNQHIFKVIPEPGVPIWLIHANLIRLLPEYRSIAAGKATTMGHIQRHHLDAPVAGPMPSELAAIGNVCDALWLRALAAERESLALAALRDALLPPLLSGALRVDQAADAAVEVLG